MLKTNSKKARENLRAYIMERENVAEYAENISNDPTFEEIAAAIYADFYRVYNSDYVKKTYAPADYFAEWAAGLPGILDTCYYYNRSAVDDLGGILEETETEKAKYKETDAEKLLSYLIYREIEKGAKAYNAEYYKCFITGIAPKNAPCKNCPFNKKCGSCK